jgi:uncharacterized protein
MKRITLIILICTWAIAVAGQNIEDETFYNVVCPDHITGNPEVPDVYITHTSFQKMFIARLKHGTDILEGLREIVESEGIRNAVIITGIGSVTAYHVHVVDNATFPSKNKYIQKDIPADITNLTGYIIDGRVHAHLTLSDEHKAIGGHLEPGTKVFTFCVLTIGILDDDTNLARFDDKTLR